jgi:recombination protein RecA
MPSSTQLRARIEADLALRVPAALTPQLKNSAPVFPTGIREIDSLLHGGFPLGALTEIVGPECSGRTSLALSFVAGLTQSGKVCAWVDVSDTLHPESAAAVGVNLTHLLWIRCTTRDSSPARSGKKTWSRLEQGLRSADLLLHAGGFHCIVLDLASLDPEYALRIPLATWFRYRAAAERLQSHVVLLTQHASTRNSAGLVLGLEGAKVLDGKTVFTGFEHQGELSRQRFAPDNVLSLRKPPRNVSSAAWQAKSLWAGQR